MKQRTLFFLLSKIHLGKDSLQDGIAINDIYILSLYALPYYFTLGQCFYVLNEVWKIFSGKVA